MQGERHSCYIGGRSSLSKRGLEYSSKNTQEKEIKELKEIVVLYVENQY